MQSHNRYLQSWSVHVEQEEEEKQHNKHEKDV